MENRVEGKGNVEKGDNQRPNVRKHGTGTAGNLRFGWN